MTAHETALGSVAVPIGGHSVRVTLDLDPQLLPVGAKIIREYNGTTYEVEIVCRMPPNAATPEARRRGWWRYVFKGRRWKSLSAIAYAITGDRYMSGNRFFGLRRRRRGK